MKYRSKVVVIDAIQWTGDNRDEILKFAPPAEWGSTTGLNVKTPEGVMHANETDWIIRGTEGEFYPCRDSVFQAKYEPVGDSPA